MSRTKCVPLKIVYGADVSARTPFFSFTEYLLEPFRLCLRRKDLCFHSGRLAGHGQRSCQQTGLRTNNAATIRADRAPLLPLSANDGSSCATPQLPGSALNLEISFNIRQLPHMNIDLTAFSAAQQRALFDLLILAMYADGHLTTVEDDQLQKLLTAFGHTEEFDRQREFDAAVTRMRPFVQSIQQAKEQALLLAEAFTTRSEQKQVYAAVQQIMTTDKHVSSWENTLLSELGLKFRM